METVGIEPTSAGALRTASTSVARALISLPGCRAGRVPGGQPLFEVPTAPEAQTAGCSQLLMPVIRPADEDGRQTSVTYC